MGSKVFPGYHQVKTYVHEVNIPNPFGKVKWPQIVVKARPYIYSTESTVENPKAKIKIVADLHLVKGCIANDGVIKANISYIQRCLIDVDTFTIRHGKTNDIIECENSKEVIDAIYAAVFHNIHS